MIEILILVIERAVLWSFFFFFSGLTNSVVYLIGQLLFIFSDYPVSIRSWNLEKKLNFGLNLCMGGRLPAVAGMPANRAFLEFPAGQSDLPKKCMFLSPK